MLGVMAGTWRQRLQRCLDDNKDLTMKGVSLTAGLNETAVRDILERDRTPSVDNFFAIAQALGVPPSWLLEGEEPPLVRIPIIGEVSAGEAWQPVDDLAPGASLDMEDFSITGSDPIGIRVRGDSMFPVYRGGDILIASRIHGANIQDALNRDCIVRTVTDEAYIKILRRGTGRGTFTLRSYNPAYDDIVDVQLEWAAPVRWIKRS